MFPSPNSAVRPLALAFALGSGSAYALEQGDFPAPALGGFTLYDSSHVDGDGDGNAETLIRRYANFARDRLFSMETRGRVWAWSLDRADGNAAGPAGHYVIRDSDCDGRFDERLGLDEEFQLPECLRQG